MIRIVICYSVLLLLSIGCEKESTGSIDDSAVRVNTLGASDLGNPANWGHIDDYIDLEVDINMIFHYYNYKNYSLPILFDPAIDRLTLKSFNDYEVIRSESAELAQYLIQDTTSILAVEIDTSKEIYSTPFKNVKNEIYEL